MGTNFFLHTPNELSLHIGKSSAGWVFALHVEPHDPLFPSDWNEWKERLEGASSNGCHIEDGHGTRITADEMIRIVTDRSFPRERGWGFAGNRETFHAINDSQDGPNGLVRAKVGLHCIANGEGTWDLHVGEFS